MAQCPSCSQNIAITEDHYGTLYRCEHCKAEFFIGFDGVPENSKQATPEEKLDSNIQKDHDSLVIDMQPKVDLTFDQTGDPQTEQQSSHLFNIEPTPNEPQSIDLGMPLSANSDSSFDLSPISKPNEPGNAFKNFTDDVEKFGNEVSVSGILSFDIEISGIDIANIRQELIEALDDNRFGWNIDEINQSIKDGKLVLKNISAPKIIVLVKRITPIGLNLNWRHNVSTQ